MSRRWRWQPSAFSFRRRAVFGGWRRRPFIFQRTPGKLKIGIKIYRKVKLWTYSGGRVRPSPMGVDAPSTGLLPDLGPRLHLPQVLRAKFSSATQHAAAASPPSRPPSSALPTEGQCLCVVESRPYRRGCRRQRWQRRPAAFRDKQPSGLRHVDAEVQRDRRDGHAEAVGSLVG